MIVATTGTIPALIAAKAAMSPVPEAARPIEGVSFVQLFDLPWVDDGTRYFHDPAVRRNFHRATERELVSRGVKFVRVRGNPEQRRTQAIEAIDDLLRTTNVRR